MSRQVTLYRILIASPSDVEEERKAIPEVISSWNAANSLKYGVTLEPVLWETHATPEMGDRPQDILNKQFVDSCDILVGAFWTRLGTHTGKAESGTVEEIERFIKAGKPVLLYFSLALVRPDSVDDNQHKRLRQFKEKCRKEGILFEYESIADLRLQLQGHITRTINSLHEASDEGSAKVEADKENIECSDLEMFKSEFMSFLTRLEAEWNAERDSMPASLDEAKDILDNACSDILDFRAQIVSDEDAKVPKIMNEATTRLKAIQEHSVVLDGGISYNAFWDEGNKIIALLKRIPDEINIS